MDEDGKRFRAPLRSRRGRWKLAAAVLALFSMPAAATAQATPDTDPNNHIQPGTPAHPNINFFAIHPTGSPLPQFELGPYRPLSGQERFEWFFKSTFGPWALGAGILASGIETARDVPEEYGPTWAGFAKRYRVRLSAVAIDHGIEAGLGALWDEDPRYFRMPDQKFGDRIRSVVEQAFLTRRSDGTFGLAYARFVAVSSGNFITKEWRPPSQANTSHATLRITYSFAWRMASNAMQEFWPDVKQRVLHREEYSPPD